MLLFNWFGYRLFVSYLDNRINTRLEAQLDNSEYNESELICLKVPATHLAYYNNSTTFERVDGQIEINGIAYKYVKRRLYNDSVELLCIPDMAFMHLQSARDDFFKITNDLQNTEQSRKSGTHAESKFFAVDCYITGNISSINDLFFPGLRAINNEHSHLPSPYLSDPGQPPQMA
jgi:hypothetical protein